MNIIMKFVAQMPLYYTDHMITLTAIYWSLSGLHKLLFICALPLLTYSLYQEIHVMLDKKIPRLRTYFSCSFHQKPTNTLKFTKEIKDIKH